MTCVNRIYHIKMAVYIIFVQVTCMFKCHPHTLLHRRVYGVFLLTSSLSLPAATASQYIFIPKTLLFIKCSRINQKNWIFVAIIIILFVHKYKQMSGQLLNSPGAIAQLNSPLARYGIVQECNKFESGEKIRANPWWYFVHAVPNLTLLEF